LGKSGGPSGRSGVAVNSGGAGADQIVAAAVGVVELRTLWVAKMNLHSLRHAALPRVEIAGPRHRNVAQADDAPCSP
jgi:hypothetical protein